jgi:hypothetical protein
MKHLDLKLKTICLLTGLAGGMFLYSENRPQKVCFSEMALANIEALAGGEGIGNGYCFGSGSVDCYGYKVEMKITGLR